ncbi:MAG: DUF1512 family protein [Promethearchaeota archaeon]
MQFQTQGNDPLSIIMNLLFFVMIFMSMFYGQKIQSWKSQRVIQTALEKLKKWNTESKTRAIRKIKQFADKNLTVKDIENKLEDFLNFIMITPVSLDPIGIISKLEHVMDVREFRYLQEVKEIAVHANETEQHNLENLLEASMAINEIYRMILHFLLLGKKSKSYILLMQVEMQLGMIMGMAKAYISASKAFAEGSPIGDGLGALVAAHFIREITQEDSVPYKDIAYETIVQEAEFAHRKVYVIRAKGPGGSVGKPGEAIKKLIEQFGERIKLIIMVDAGLKMEGDKSGSIVVGVGAAIGGIGIEKYKIEETSTQKKIPIDAIICRESLEDAICTMKKPIISSIPLIIDRIKNTIRKRTSENDTVIVAGIGNSIGIGI